MFRLPVFYGNEKNFGSELKIDYHVKKVEETIDCIKGKVFQTFRVLKIISKSGVVQKIKTLVITVVFALVVNFVLPKPTKADMQFSGSDDNISKVLLVKSHDGPIKGPPARGRGSSSSRGTIPSTGIPGVQGFSSRELPFRKPPKTTNPLFHGARGRAAGGGENPGGGSPGVEQGNGQTHRSKSKRRQSKSQKQDYCSSYWKDKEAKKKSSKNEFTSVEVNEILEYTAFQRCAKDAFRDPNMQDDYNYVIKALKEGQNPLTIGKRTTTVGKNKVYIKRGLARIVVDISEKSIKVLGVSNKGNKNLMSSFDGLVKKYYDIDLVGYS